jgi:hypothetical protein
VLLLVLILVLIAFGLLVVALLSGSVLWAWVSVGVSVAAAAVLLIDWLQRRSAVRAGAEAAAASGAAPPRMRSTPDLEPATEILPVIPRSGADAAAPGRTGDTATGNRYDETADATRTVVMPVVQPSASTERPSGASHENAPSGGGSSLSVTKSGADRTVSTHSGGTPKDGAAAAESADSAPPTTAAPNTSAPPTTATPAPTTEAPPVEPAAGGDRTDAGADSPTAVARESPTKVAREPAGEAAGDDAKADGGKPVAGEADEPAGAGAPSGEPAAAGPTGAEASEAKAADRAEEQGAGTAAAAGAANGTAADGGAAPESEPPPSDAEAPEEPRDAAAAAIVAGLETEVLVVDEQPRYHLSACRALTGKATIPLPAREAVELGFTPCGWCTPDRKLAAQEPATR